MTYMVSAQTSPGTKASEVLKIHFSPQRLVICNTRSLEKLGASECSKRLMVAVKIEASGLADPQSTFKCVVSAGTLDTCGAQMVWDLKEKEARNYSLAVEFSSKSGKSSITKSIQIAKEKEDEGCRYDPVTHVTVCAEFGALKLGLWDRVDGFIEASSQNPNMRPTVLLYGSEQETRGLERLVRQRLALRKADLRRYDFLKGVEFHEPTLRFWLVPAGASVISFGNIRGMVLQKTTRQPVVDATVELVYDGEVKRTVKTNASGVYLFERVVAVESYVLKASKVGVQDSTIVLSVIDSTVTAPALRLKLK